MTAPDDVRRRLQRIHAHLLTGPHILADYALMYTPSMLQASLPSRQSLMEVAQGILETSRSAHAVPAVTEAAGTMTTVSGLLPYLIPGSSLYRTVVEMYFAGDAVTARAYTLIELCFLAGGHVLLAVFHGSSGRRLRAVENAACAAVLVEMIRRRYQRQDGVGAPSPRPTVDFESLKVFVSLALPALVLVLLRRLDDLTFYNMAGQMMHALPATKRTVEAFLIDPLARPPDMAERELKDILATYGGALGLILPNLCSKYWEVLLFRLALVGMLRRMSPQRRGAG